MYVDGRFLLLTEGLKLDQDKPRWELMIPLWPQLEQVVKVLTYGATKYADNNWQLVEPSERYWAAAQRHLGASRTEYLDEETGLPHLAHAICCLLFLLWKDTK